MVRYAHPIGKLWISKERYADMRAALEDGHTLPERHDEWQRRFEAMEQALVAQGNVVERVELNHDAFFADCRRRKTRADYDAADREANIIAHKKHRNR